MPTHQVHDEKEQFYFITFTCYKWLPLLEITKLNDYFPSWIRNLSKQGVKICGGVIMPNHVHLLVYVESDCKSLNKVIGDGKRFLAYEIVKRLKAQSNDQLLNTLSEGVQEKERLKGKKHQVFRLSFDAKKVAGEEEIHKVLEYIQHNPLEGKWNLAEDYIEYPYSSASFYETGKTNDLQFVDYRSYFSESSASDSEGV